MVDPLAVDKARREHHGENPSPFTREHLEEMSRHKQEHGKSEPQSMPSTTGSTTTTTTIPSEHKPSLWQAAIEHALHAHAVIPHSFEDNFSVDQPEQDESEYEQTVPTIELDTLDEEERLDMLQRVKDHMAHQLQEMEPIESGDVHDLVEDMEIEKTNWWGETTGEGGTTFSSRRVSSFTSSSGNIEPPKGSTRLLTETMKAWEAATHKPGLTESAKSSSGEEKREESPPPSTTTSTTTPAAEQFDQDLASVIAPSPVVHPTEADEVTYRPNFSASPVFMSSTASESQNSSSIPSRVDSNPMNAMHSAQQGSETLSIPSRSDAPTTSHRSGHPSSSVNTSSSSSSSSPSSTSTASSSTTPHTPTGASSKRNPMSAMHSAQQGSETLSIPSRSDAPTSSHRSGHPSSSVNTSSSSSSSSPSSTSTASSSTTPHVPSGSSSKRSSGDRTSGNEGTESHTMLGRVEEALENFAAELHKAHAFEPSHYNDDFSQDQLEPSINQAVTPEQYKLEHPENEEGMAELAETIEALPGKLKMAQDESWTRQLPKKSEQQQQEGSTTGKVRPLSPDTKTMSKQGSSGGKKSFLTSGGNKKKGEAEETTTTTTTGDDRPPLSTFWERLENIAAQLHGFRALEPHEYSDNFSVDQPLHESLVQALTPEEVDTEQRLHLRSPPASEQESSSSKGRSGSKIIVSTLEQGLQEAVKDMERKQELGPNPVDPEGLPFVVQSSEELQQRH